MEQYQYAKNIILLQKYFCSNFISCSCLRCAILNHYINISSRSWVLNSKKSTRRHITQFVILFSSMPPPPVRSRCVCVCVCVKRLFFALWKSLFVVAPGVFTLLISRRVQTHFAVAN